MMYFANKPPFPPPELPDKYTRVFLKYPDHPEMWPDPPDEHELAPLLSVADQRNRNRLQAAASWIRMTEALRPALDRIAAAGYRLWAWKGLDYALSLYDSPCDRPMCDLDVFVEPESLSEIMDILLRGGWRLSSKIEYLFSCGIISELKLRRNKVLLEIHTHPFYFPATFKGRIPKDLFDEGRILQPGLQGFRWEYALLLTLLHHAQQSASRQVWWIDEALLIRNIWRQNGDWYIFTRSAAETGLGNELVDILRVLEDLPGVDLPYGLLSLLIARNSSSSCRLDRLRGPRGSATVQNVLSLTGWRRVSFLCDRCFRGLRSLAAAVIDHWRFGMKGKRGHQE